MDDTIDVKQYIDGIRVFQQRRRCSPCVSGWSQSNGYVNIGIPCRKAFDDMSSSFGNTSKLILPCGVNKFDTHTAACLNVSVYVTKGLSHFARNLFQQTT